MKEEEEEEEDSVGLGTLKGRTSVERGEETQQTHAFVTLFKTQNDEPERKVHLWMQL